MQATFQLEEQSSTNFVNPVYDTMFADEDDLLDASGGGPILRVPVSPLGENVGGEIFENTCYVGDMSYSKRHHTLRFQGKNLRAY